MIFSLRARPIGRARRAKLDGYAKRLKGYVLEPYVAYWQLNLRLEQASPGEVRAFPRRLPRYAARGAPARRLAEAARQEPAVGPVR